MVYPDELQLIDEITRAFEDTHLEDGISLNMAKYRDSGGSRSIYYERAASDERDSWQAIPDNVLEEFSETFSFTDLKGFRFYIPAYMIWTIKHHRTSDLFIADQTIYALNPDHFLFRDAPFHEWWTEKQLKVIVKFLRYCRENSDTLDATFAEKNLAAIL